MSRDGRAAEDERLTKRVNDTGSAYDDDWLALDLQGLGLVRGILYNVDQDDANEKERRRGTMNRLPDRALAWDFIRFAVEHEENEYWPCVTLKWVPNYAPNHEAIARPLLTRSDGLICR